MCGISGFAGHTWKQEQLECMVAAMVHRGPDDRGLFMDASAAAGLGHDRLSIIDLTPAGHMPMTDPTGRIHLVYNGEIYNYLELRNELTGYPFNSRADSEVLLAAYLHWGETCLDHFVGMFAFILWDEEKQRLFAARDRFGIKPLFYHSSGRARSRPCMLPGFPPGRTRLPGQPTWRRVYIIIPSALSGKVSIRCRPVIRSPGRQAS
jgi:asparagine synthase (glutamine-hydrolysing)